jgi:hypothetical protein
MYYTIVPIEWLLEEDEEEAKPKRREVEVNGVTLIVEQSDFDSFKIVQIISSDPSHYLNEAYQPGKTLSLKPLL